MKYEFPSINHIDEVLEAIADREEFIVAEREGFKVINYLVHLPDTFPTPDTKDPKLNRLYALRRECRGLKFDVNGKIIARPYSKFFNLNEKPETSENLINTNEPHVILDKLDGSMIHPLWIDSQLFWSTKMGLTDIAADAGRFVENSDRKYVDLAVECRDLGLTPIFEWCSRKQRIVIDYPDDDLVLTAIRFNYTGHYVSYNDLQITGKKYDIPVVKAWGGGFNDLHSFVDEVSKRQDEEGYVLRFHSGHMLKIKNEWYCAIHKTKELLTFEKDVIALILNERDDDAKAFMSDEDKNRLETFSAVLFDGINKTADNLKWEVIAAKDNLNESKKRFALEVVPNFDDNVRGLLFKIWDDGDAFEIVRNYVLSNTGSSTKVDSIRKLIGGIRWEDY